ncbi:unnamed protein product [Adineta steineri]|uniref:Uncharacterized protein n=1 Tax=Adineta steineri TaxID=433720 RepID=A0A814WA77_9BILA|nr:unnamed protein product [Adineta steineri]CAF3993367.1 unnamed protein product [Adineta steineri]
MIPFSQSNKNISFKQNYHRLQEHLCIFDCTFTIPFNESLVIPSNCQQALTTNPCEVDIIVELTMKRTTFAFLNKTNDSLINGLETNTFSVELVNFEFEKNLITDILAYKCSHGDKCEWNYIQKKIPKVISMNYQPLLDSLSPLIYDKNLVSNVSHCHSWNELVNCQIGVCEYMQTLDHSSLTLPSIRQCSISDRPSIYFGQYQYIPDPMKYTFDYLYFTCNKNQCNSPSNERAIKYLIGYSNHKNISVMKKGHFYLVFSFYLIIVVLIKMI